MDSTSIETNCTAAEVPSVEAGDTPARRCRFGDWVSRFLAGNPFYMASAALLLFGINRLVVDPDFLGAETPKLIFSFSALQVYEVVLVGVAIWLAQRRIWYDATLLVVLDNALVLVAFILVTQAVLIGHGLALALSLTGAVLVLARLGSACRFIPKLNLPSPWLRLGGVVLAVNLALPFIFRPIMEEDVGNWEIPGQYMWMLALPLLQLTANLPPAPTQWGGLPMQRSWLPFLVFTLWMVGSGVHLYCVGYVCGLSLELFLLAPVLWASAWTFHWRMTDWLPHPGAGLRIFSLFPPALATVLALGHALPFLSLTALNFGVYGTLGWLGRDRRVTVPLLLASVAAMLAAMPLEWGGVFIPEFGRGKSVFLGVTMSLFLYAATSRLAAVGIGGAILLALTPPLLCGAQTVHLPLQMGAVFTLLHSLRWQGRAPAQVNLLRLAVSAIWVVDSLVWTRNFAPLAVSTVSGGAGLVLGVCWLAWLFTGKCRTRVLPVAGFLVLLATPLNYVFDRLKSSHPGVAAIAGAFILLALGTALALTRHRWSQSFKHN